MEIHKTLQVIVGLVERGLIKEYALTGAVAAVIYIQPTSTEDVDILVSVATFEQRPSGLILVSPIDQALADLGYTQRSGAGIVIEGWPVEFLPVGSELDEECLSSAIEMEVGEGIRFRVVRPEHLVAKSISVGRLKDLARVEAFLDQDAVDLTILKSLIERFGLHQAWAGFCSRAGRPDPLGLD